MKKAFVFLFAVCLIVLLAPPVQAADGGTCGDGVTWKLEDGTLTISGTGAMADYSFREELPWYDRINDIAAVVIEKGITQIGQKAFYKCDELTSVTIGDGVNIIGNSAFENCSSLMSVTIPSSVINIGESAFSGCRKLSCITIPNSIAVIGNNAFDGCWNLQDVFYEGDLAEWCSIVFKNGSSANPMSKANNVYLNGELLTGAVAIPNGVSNVGDFSFSGCSTLTGVTIPGSVTNIGFGAFTKCANMKYIFMPESVISIEGAAFQYCTGLTNIVIPEGVTCIEHSVFSNCTNLVSITIPESISLIRDDAFYNCSNISIIHYTGTEEQSSEITIEDYGNSSLDNVVWHYGVTEDKVAGQTVYYCAECNLYYLCDGTEYVTKSKPNLAGTGFTLSYEDEILVNFYFTISNVNDVIDCGMLVFYTDPGEADFSKADAVCGSEYVASSDSYIATTDGIAAKEMGDNRYYCAYAKLSDGSYAYSPLYQYSPKKYAMNMLGKDTTSDKQKALCVAMLNYGAAAQEYFGYKTDDLMNVNLTEEQKAMVAPYDAGLFAGAVAADPAKIGVFTATDGFDGKSASVSFEGAFSINFYFVPNAVMDSNLVFYYWTSEDYANADTLTPSNASGKLIMELKDGVYTASVEGIAPKDLDKTYYVAGAYMSDMQIHCTGVIAYSLSKYCINNATGNMGALAQATAMYGYYAKQYFG